MVVTSDKSNFDVQFEFGDMSQQKLVEVFTGEASTLEIKSERARNWSKTGNICIEYAYDRWNPESKERIQSKSGISTSTSAHWAQMLMLDDGSYGVMLVFPTTFLQSLIKKWWNTAKKIEVTRDSAVETTTVTRGKAYCMLMPIADIMVELQRTGGYYMENVKPYSNGRKVDRMPDEIIPFDPEGGGTPSIMSTEPKTFEEACDIVTLDIAELVSSKQHDYGKDNILGFGEQGLVVRLWDKINRLKNLVWNNTRPKNESVEDTLHDIAGYAIIGLLLRKGWFELPMRDE